MKPLLPALLMLPALAAHANLLVTEINSNASPADFWELTNFGAAAVNLGDYVWNDDRGLFDESAAKVIPAGTQIAPGESLVFAVTPDVAAFRTAWNLPPAVQVIGGGPGLGQNDQVNLFTSTAAPSPLVSLNYAAGGFTRSNGLLSLGGHAGISAGGAASTQSLIWDPNSGLSLPRFTFATGGNFNTYQATGGAIGSPGFVGTAGSNSAPVFSGPAATYWRLGQALANADFRILASDADPGQMVTVTLVGAPAWLGLAADGPGNWKLTGTPVAGRHEFTARASDNAPGGPGSTDRAYTLTVFPATAPVILNEFNAISDTNLPTAADPWFGLVPGNGGDWFELVVTGTGAAGSTVDLRGWKIDITTAGQTETIVLSQDPYWASVMAGTILTFIENNSAGGGMDTAINHTSTRHTTGLTWSNIWISDPFFIDREASDFGNGIVIDNNDTTFTIRNAAGTVVSGPAGESVAHKDSNGNNVPDELVAIGSDEVMVLREDPLHSVDPFFGRYREENASTFGAPNQWGTGPSVQGFASYIRANTPPVFTTSPPPHARGGYRYEITAIDPNGTTPSVAAAPLPAFLTLTPGPGGTAVLESNRPLTADDAGEHPIRLQVADADTATPQAFTLTVFSPNSPVIVNEFNAVAPDKYLNGGTVAFDDDGAPVSTDSYFGRVPGNGGDWVELVVTGDGSPGRVDLRGWRIEIGRTRGGMFNPESTLALAADPAWEALPAGTLLTFTAANSAQGGLDTIFGIRDRRATHGDSWTNVWIGDPTLLAYTSPAANGYTITGGVVEGLQIDAAGTQFRLIDAAGRVAFGPCGEGIAPPAGLSDTEIFELEDHPRAATSPLVTAGLSTPGYDDGASGSTFGWPNEWQTGEGGALTVQDFSIFVPTRYQLWLEAHSLAGPAGAPDADPDLDGRNNFAEFAFGGLPLVADAAPATDGPGPGTQIIWSYTRRADDPALEFRHESSTDLNAWHPLTVELVSSLPISGLPGYNRVTLRCDRPVPEPPKWFVRTIAE
jgi:hypothetical protein